MRLRSQAQRASDARRELPTAPVPRSGQQADPASEVAASIEAAGTRLRPDAAGAHALTPERILRLQRSAGNRGVVALLETARATGGRAVARRVTAPPKRKRRRAVQRDFLDDVSDAVSDTIDTVADTASDVAGGVRDTVVEAGGAVGEAAGEAWDYAESGAEAAASAAREVASDVVDVAADVAGDVAETAATAWDTVTTTASEVADDVATGAQAVWDETTEVVSDVVDGVSDVAATAWDGLADTARRAAEGASDVAGDVWNAVAEGADQVWTGVKGLASSAWDTVTDVASGAWDAVRSTASEIAGGVRDLAVQAWNGIKGAAGAAWDAVAGAVGSLWDSITGRVGRLLERLAQHVPAPGKDVRSRGLNDTERARARLIFGDAIDLNVVVVTRGGLLGSDTCRTTANTISMSERYFPPDEAKLELTPEGVEVLIHELTHVMQYQQEGLGYIPESLWDQYKSWRKTGKVDEAYDWRPLDAAGIPWSEWHVEPQAQAVEDYNHQLGLRESDKEEDRKKFDAVTFGRLAKYAEFMRRGPRAS